MHFRLTIATYLIAAWAVSTGAEAQNVYKCGANYSERPCENGVTLPLSEQAPSPADKKAMDQATQRDVRLANALEKERLQQERLALARAKPSDAASIKQASTTRKKASTQKEKPLEPFVAHVPGEKKSKKSKKKTTTAEQGR